MIKKKGRGFGMTKTKTIDELTLMDDYMFAQVMRDKRHLKPLLEYILKVRIAKIDFIEPKTQRRKARPPKESGSTFT